LADFDLSNFLASFFDEARERLNSINQGLVNFEAGNLDAEGLVALRRDAHTIKGSALMLGVPDIGGTAHLFEDVMEQLIENPSWRTAAMTQFLYDLHDVLDVRLQDPDAQKNIDIEPLRIKHKKLLKAAKAGLLQDIITTPVQNKDKSDNINEVEQEPSSSTLSEPIVSSSTLSLENENKNLDAYIQDEAAEVKLDTDTPSEKVSAVQETAVPAFSGLIGADEADSWKAERAKKRNVDQAGSANDTSQLNLNPSLGILPLSNEKKNDFIKGESSNKQKSPSALEIENQSSEKEDQINLVGDAPIEPTVNSLLDDKLITGVPEGLGNNQTIEITFDSSSTDILIDSTSESLTDDQPIEAVFKSFGDDKLVESPPENLANDRPVGAVFKSFGDDKLVESTPENLGNNQPIEAVLESFGDDELVDSTPDSLGDHKSVETMSENLDDDSPIDETLESLIYNDPTQDLLDSNSIELISENPLNEEELTNLTKNKALDRLTRPSIDQPVNATESAANIQSTSPPLEPVNLSPLPEQDFSIDTYRPDMAQIEMKTTAQRHSSGRFLRVDAERLENLSNQVIELSTAQSRGHAFENVFLELAAELRGMQREWRYFSKSYSDFDEAKRQSLMLSFERGFESQVRKHRRLKEEISVSQQRGELMHRDLRDQVLSLMLRPLDSVFSTFPRAVRDVAVRLNKRARLVIGGKTLEMDQGVAESLVEPLVHLLNNSVAHGIELPAVRKALGKPEEGQISVIARQSGSEVRIEVVDDGQGLDVERIKEVAVDRGVTTQIEADNMDSAEILEMIFRPGFTTKKEVDSTSGRGIGMNVVQDTIRRLTGSIRIHTEIGRGTRFVLSLPVSIAVQQALMFRMGNMRFGMLTHMVEQAIPLHKQDLQIGVGGKKFIMYGKHQVPVVDMRRMLSGVDSDEGLSKTPNVLIAEHIEGYVGIVVDELMNDIEIVVRKLDPYIKRYQPQGLMGNTIADDGSVVMLLEPYGIKEMGRTAPDHDIAIDVGEDDKLNLKILLVDDSLIARAVEKSIFESIGFIVDTAIDGLDGLEKLKMQSYDMIVTDLEMPRLDGFGFVRRIRNQAEYEDLPLIVISTRESAEDRMRAMESGADTYMVKQHLNGDEILKTVQALLGI